MDQLLQFATDQFLRLRAEHVWFVPVVAAVVLFGGYGIVMALLEILHEKSVAALDATIYRYNRSRRAKSEVNAARLEAEIDRGKVIAYDGTVRRSFPTENGSEFIWKNFLIRRNTLLMNAREREAVLLFEVLKAEGQLGRYAKHILFALAWGDGRGEIVQETFGVSKSTLKKIQMKSFRDVVAAEVARLDLSIDGALSKLLAFMHEAARRDPSPAITYLIDRHRVPTILDD